MYEVYVGDDNPIARYALVLIDEIDAHMHPYWQLKLIPLLRKCFPNVQFVATTHSPLVLCNVGDGAVFLCERDESDNLLQVRRKKGSLNGLGADGLLTSSYFGLRTQLDDATQKLLDQKVEYAARDKGVRLTAKERAELEKINRKLDEVGLLTTFADPYYTAFLQGLARKRKLSEFQKQTFSNKALQEREQLIDEIFKELEEEETNAVR
jgi:predicted ATP-binding protein involved in virulence